MLSSDEELTDSIRNKYGIVDEPSIVETDDYIEEEEMEPCQLLRS